MRFQQADLGLQSMLETAYPVGSIFVSTLPASPEIQLGFGVWVPFGAGRVLVGFDAGDADFDAAEKTSGAKTVTLTTNEMPSHTHIQDPHSHTVTSQGTASGAQAGAIRDTSSNNPQNDTNPTGSAVAVNQNTGGGAAHNNVQPSIVVYRWKRTA